MKLFLQKIRPLVFSILLLYPAQIAAQLFVYFFVTVTGQLIPGYALGCVLFGTLAALPVLKKIRQGNKPNVFKRVLGLLTVLLMSGILFLSMASFNTR